MPEIKLTTMARIVCCVLIGSVWKPLQAADSPAVAQKPISRELIRQSIAHLGDPNFRIRTNATKQLIAVGPAAVGELVSALGSRDAEVVARSRYILTKLIHRNEAAFSALEKVASSPERRSAELAEAILQLTPSDLRRRESDRRLRDARAALDQRRFKEARQNALAAQALGLIYGLFEDHPAQVLQDIEHAEARVVANNSEQE